MRDKATIEKKKQRLIEMTTAFCDEYIDEDYRQLCEKLIQKISQKRNVPFLYGRMEIWAAAIVHALGQINFLFDRNFDPYASTDDICNYFGTSRSTTSQKAKKIRDMFKMRYWDPEFSTKHMKENDPFADLVMMNRLIVDIKDLHPELQKILRKK